MPISLKQWLREATPEQASRLAKLAKTSVRALQNIVYGHRRGSAERAIRVRATSLKIETEAPGWGDTSIDQASICPACRKCPYYNAKD